MGQNIFLEVMYEGDKFDTAALRSQDKRSKRHSCLTGPLLLTSFLNFDIIEERAIIRWVQFVWTSAVTRNTYPRIQPIKRPIELHGNV